MELWIDGARRVAAWQDGGSMLGGPPRVVWHTTENDPHSTTAYAIANYLNRVGYAVHIVWNPVTGEFIQMLPADRAGRGLKNLSGGVQTNRQGTACLQIEVVAHAATPFTQYEMKGREAILQWIRSFGIPDVWPGGPPPAAPQTAHVSTAVWTGKAGHYGHSQIPENDHNDPGAIDIAKLFGTDDMEPSTSVPVGKTYDGDFEHESYPASFVWIGSMAEAKRAKVAAQAATAEVQQMATRLDEIEKKVDQVLAKLAA